MSVFTMQGGRMHISEGDILEDDEELKSMVLHN